MILGQVILGQVLVPLPIASLADRDSITARNGGVWEGAASARVMGVAHARSIGLNFLCFCYGGRNRSICLLLKLLLRHRRAGPESTMTYIDIERASSVPVARSRREPLKSVRQQRLERLAELLDQRDGAIPLLTRMEYSPWHERPYLREDKSPLSVAFEDEGFRRQGLSGDRLGDIMDFFELNEREAHHLLCYCHYAASVTAPMVAARARELAAKRTLRQMWEGLRMRLFHGAAA